MTKKSILRLLQASLMCCLAVLFTACDDIFASEDNPTPAYLSMSDKPVTLKVGDTYRRKAISVTTAVVEYTSSKTDVATVDNEGLVTAKAEGTTTITATATGYSSQNGKKIYQPASVSYVVTVTPATVAVTGLTLNKANLRFDKNVLTAQTLTATVLPLEATDKSVTWTSSDETVATVDANGQVTPKAKGIATITATTTDGGKKATSTVYVYDKIHNINTDGNANVAGGEFWLIEGNGSEIGNAITINASPTTTVTTVTLNGINITKGIECLGDATIILADGSTNTVTASIYNAGIKIGDGATTTLTINGETAGTGTLTAQGGMSAAGIGTDRNGSGGNIVINGGTVTAIGGNNGAGIGTGRAQGVSITCGDITINGGTVTATGVDNGAGIGTGLSAGTGASNTCGAIMIGTGVTMVTATKGSSAPNSIGKGSIDPVNGGNQACGKIKIGGVEYWDGAAYQNGGDNATTGLPHSPYTYTPAP